MRWQSPTFLVLSECRLPVLMTGPAVRAFHFFAARTHLNRPHLGLWSPAFQPRWERLAFTVRYGGVDVTLASEHLGESNICERSTWTLCLYRDLPASQHHLSPPPSSNTTTASSRHARITTRAAYFHCKAPMSDTEFDDFERLKEALVGGRLPFTSLHH